MSTTIMVKCDNPACGVVGVPEWVRQPGEPESKAWPDGVAAPYGWLYLSGGWQGCGPSFTNLMCCSLDCVTPALDAAPDDGLPT